VHLKGCAQVVPEEVYCDVITLIPVLGEPYSHLEVALSRCHVAVRGLELGEKAQRTSTRNASVLLFVLDNAANKLLGFVQKKNSLSVSFINRIND